MIRKPVFLLFPLLFLDWASKLLVSLVGFPYFKNYGIAFGLLQNSVFSSWTYHTVFILVGLLYLKKKLNEVGIASYAAVIFLSGSLGNLVDKMTWGYVVDFIPFLRLGFFNLSDVYLVTGLVGILFVESRRK